jgi:hypothetical protein
LSKSRKEGGIGLRDLYGFNLAMLVTQGWRMLRNPYSLCSRVSKARYFPNSSILEAHPMPGISYTWRSILKGNDFLKEGLVWRIGDGVQVNVWTDPCLPKNGSRIPITPRGQHMMTKVNEFIDPYTGTWEEALVRSTVWAADAENILTIPIREDSEDFPACMSL